MPWPQTRNHNATGCLLFTNYSIYSNLSLLPWPCWLLCTIWKWSMHHMRSTPWMKDPQLNTSCLWIILHQHISSREPHTNLHVNVVDSPMNINELPCRLGHLNFWTLWEIISKEAISGLEIDTKLTDEFCTSCVQGNVSQHPFPHESETKFTKYGEKIVTDLWGPS